MTDYYILDENKQIIACEDIIKWGKWMQIADRKIARDTIDDIVISTVFLGLDHSYGGKIPILFETMIFGGKHDKYQNRYVTIEEALIGHEKAVELVKKEK